MIQVNDGTFAGKVFSDLKAMSKAYWDSWTDDEKKLVEACIADASKLALRAVAGEDIAKEKAQVDAQLKGIKVAGQATAKEVVWTYVARTVQAVVSTLL